MTEEELHLKEALRASPRATPAVGFDSRLIAGAHGRMRARRRRRMVLVGANLALAAVAAVVLARGATSTNATQAGAAPTVAGEPLPSADEATTGGADAMRDLLTYTTYDPKRAARPRWDYINEPLAAYAVLLDTQ